MVFFGGFQRSRVGAQPRFRFLGGGDAATNLILGGGFLLPNRVPRLAASLVLRVEIVALAPQSRAVLFQARLRASTRRVGGFQTTSGCGERRLAIRERGFARGDSLLPRANRLRLGRFLRGGYRGEVLELARAGGDRLEFGARVGFQRANLVSRRAFSSPPPHPPPRGRRRSLALLFDSRAMLVALALQRANSRCSASHMDEI